MSAAAAAFASQEAIVAGEWDPFLLTLLGAIRDRLELTNPHQKPRRRADMASHQVWAWMHGPGTPHWEIRGTGVVLPEEVK